MPAVQVKSMVKPLLGLLMLVVAASLPASPRSPSVPADWKSHRDAAMGFEVRYPADWHVRLSNAESVSIDRTPVAGIDNMAIQFDVQRNINPDGLPIGDWIAEQTRKLKAAHLQASSVEVGGRQAIRWERVDTFGRKFTFFVALNRTDVFQITAYQTEATKQLDPTYAAIVSTIRFPD